MNQLSLFHDAEHPTHVCLDGRQVGVTDAFWTYWYLAAERQAMFNRRVKGAPGPWTEDEILANHRFTNAYRASDRVSQYLLHHVIYDKDRDPVETAFRVILFKIFNRIDTWEHLVSAVGEPSTKAFDPITYGQVLNERMNAGERLYSAAYIMPSPNLGQDRKHTNHLELLFSLLIEGTLCAFAEADSLEELYELLRAVPSFGPFLAFQYAIDLNYSAHFAFSEMDFVVAGPGALRGIKKCFSDTGTFENPDALISAMAAEAPRFLSDTHFEDLWGRPLHLIDIQNLFCELDKYARVAHPDIDIGGPTRIKQSFVPRHDPLTLGYPPKWSLPWSAQQPTRIEIPIDLSLGEVTCPFPAVAEPTLMATARM